MRKERSISTSKIRTRSSKKSWDGSRSQQRSETGAAKPPVTADLVKKKTEEAKKTMKESAESGETFGLVVHSSFDDHLSCTLPPGYTEASLTIDEVRGPLVCSYHESSSVCKLGTDCK